MLPNVSSPVPGQTIESMVAANWLWNSWTSWEGAAKVVFGSSKTKSGSLIHGGWSEAFEALQGEGFSSPLELIERHSYLPLFRPFADKATYQRLSTALAQGEVTKLSALCRSSATRVGSIRFCPACAAEDLRRLGYAVARRHHQVSCVEACPKHGVLTIPLTSSAPAVERLAEHGLFVPKPDACRSQHDTLGVEQATHASSAQVRYASLIEAALTGQLPPSPHHVRQQTILARLEDRYGAARIPGRTLVKLLREAFADSALAEAGLSLASNGGECWPALLVDGSAFSHHPIANLLVVALLFDDVPDYLNALEAIDIAPPQARLPPSGMQFGSIASVLQPALIKDCLRDLSLAEVAHRNGLDLTTVRSVLRQFPRLARQRQQSCFRRKRKTHRAAALELKRTHPRAARQDLKNLSNADYAWLAQNDRQWLDEQFPMVRPPRDRSHLYDIHLDSSAAAFASSLPELLASTGRGGVRRTWSLMLQCFGPETQKQLRTGRLPIAVRSLRAHEESKAQHRERILRDIQTQVAQSHLCAAKQLAKELLKSQAQDEALIERVLTCLLPDSESSGSSTEPLRFSEGQTATFLP
jgi:hypothetical protein